MILAQLTDTHVLEPDETQFVDNNHMLTVAVESLNAESPRPDAVIGTGDLTNWARPGQYTELADRLGPLELPFFPMVGNHDDRGLMKETFPDVPWADADHASWVVEIADATVVGLDSTDPGRHGAAFDGDRRAWLDAALGSATAPVILALHHPPFATGLAWMDAFGFAGLDEFSAVVAEHAARIARIVCGHIHRPLVATVGGVTASICPSTVHHIGLDLSANSSPSVIRDPRGYQLHLINGDDVVTHTRHIDTGEDAFDPGWN